MYVAHSNFMPVVEAITEKEAARSSAFSDRYNRQLFAKACEKYKDRIQAIQQHLPSWMPENPNK